MQSLYYSMLSILFLLCYISITECEESEEDLASTVMLPQDSEARLATVTAHGQCPIWFFYNTTTGQCVCYNDIPHFKRLDETYHNGIKCAEQKAFIAYNNYYYMTYSKKMD